MDQKKEAFKKFIEGFKAIAGEFTTEEFDELIIKYEDKTISDDLNEMAESLERVFQRWTECT